MMTANDLMQFLLWSALVNYAILVLWFVVFTVWGERIVTLHARWFPTSRERLMQAMYLLLGGYKLAILFFNLVPYLVLRLLA